MNDLQNIFGEFDKSRTPVCRFGPGGDFLSDWPAKTSETCEVVEENHIIQPLSKVLASIAKIIGATSETLISTTKSVDTEDIIDTKHSDKSNAQTNAGLKNHLPVPTQKLLFDNDTGVGKLAGYKPNHRVRTHRRAKRKRPVMQTDWQGTLFESHPQSAKVA